MIVILVFCERRKEMNEAITRVFANKDEIISKTKRYQQLKTNNIQHDYVKERKKLCDYFDKKFSDDEIMVIQSIMYFGRECYCGYKDEYNGTINEVISFWMENLFFSFGKEIDKDIEISQMVGKSLKIGTYFEFGFKELCRRNCNEI